VHHYLVVVRLKFVGPFQEFYRAFEPLDLVIELCGFDLRVEIVRVLFRRVDSGLYFGS
jgi:hypothetical protein